MKWNYAMLSRSLIALLFVYAGIGKIMDFSKYVTMMSEKFGSLASTVLVLVILIEIVVALMFAVGYKLCWTAWILAAFTALATILYHNPWAGEAFAPMALSAALKNIAIIGGILAASCWGCGDCHCDAKEKKPHHHH